jgi:hypothetical protein
VSALIGTGVNELRDALATRLRALTGRNAISLP